MESRHPFSPISYPANPGRPGQPIAAGCIPTRLRGADAESAEGGIRSWPANHGDIFSTERCPAPLAANRSTRAPSANDRLSILLAVALESRVRQSRFNQPRRVRPRFVAFPLTSTFALVKHSVGGFPAPIRDLGAPGARFPTPACVHLRRSPEGRERRPLLISQ